jgi:hypothetical protein
MHLQVQRFQRGSLWKGCWLVGQTDWSCWVELPQAGRILKQVLLGRRDFSRPC